MMCGIDRRKLVTTVQNTADMERTGKEKKKGLGIFPLHFIDDFYMVLQYCFHLHVPPVQPVSTGQDMRLPNTIANTP